MALDFERLKAFRAVAQERSFSRGAKRIFRTQPAVSQSVAALERQVGQRLFDRLGRRVQLTPAGETLLTHVQEAFRTLENAQAQLDALGGLKRGMLRIGASDTTTCYLLPQVLRVFRERHPGVEIIISNRPSPGVVQQVVAREVDLGLVTLPVRHPGVAVREAAEREDVLICAPDHRLTLRRRARLEDAVRYPLLLLDRGSSTRSFIDARLQAAGLAPQVAMELASIEVIKRLVQLDLGVSIVPRVAVQEEVAAGKLCALCVFRRDERRKLGFIHSRNAEPTPAAREFLRLALERLRAGTP